MVILLILLLILIFGVLLWRVPKWQVAKSGVTDAEKRFGMENDARKVLAEIFGGIFLILGLYGTVQTFRLSRDTQVTERLSKAFGQLGDDHLEARLGGIYSLERLAQDSERDHWPVMEVLAQVIRAKASEDKHIEEVTAYPKKQRAWALFPWPPADVQAALTVLGRRSRHYRDGERERLDLRDVVLVGARLTGAHLEGANLARVDFGGVVLSEMSGGTFQEVTDLSGANFREAILDGAYFGRSNLSGARLGRASLKGADLSEVAGLTQKQVDEACVGPDTRLPPGLKRPKPC
jgi:hypothetical protein